MPQGLIFFNHSASRITSNLFSDRVSSSVIIMPAQILALSLRRAPSRALREESHRIASTSDTFRRCYHTTRKLHDTPNREPQSLDARTPFQIPKIRTRTPEKLVYKMTFTCKPCSARSTHEVSKQGYHHGSVLITCPDCKNRHVISDHLKVGQTVSVRMIDYTDSVTDIWRKAHHA